MARTSRKKTRPAPWTEQDRKDLAALAAKRLAGNRLDWKTIKARFPNRSQASISKKLGLWKLTVNLQWTKEEDRILLEEWNEVSSRTLGLKLPGRTKMARYDRAQELGLCAGAPQGMVSVKSLSEDPKWGYDYYTTLKILKAGEVPVKSRNYASHLNRPGVRYVDPDEATEAAAAWEKSRASLETVLQASDRIGMASHTMWKWLTLEGLVPQKSNVPGQGRTFSALPEVYDRVNKKYRVRRHGARPLPPKAPSPRLGRESPKMAAKRIHVREETLRKWLTLEGLLPPVTEGTRTHHYAPPEEYDRVAEKYRTGRNAPKGSRHPLVAEDNPDARSSTRMAGALPATMTPPPA
jgi:hypothetical protein